MNGARLSTTKISRISETVVLPDANLASLLNTSIQHSSNYETSYHHSIHPTASFWVDVPTSYLLNSLYLLESSYLLQNSLDLLNNSNHTETDSHTVLSSSLPLPLSSQSLFSSQEIDLSFQKDLHTFIDDTIEETISPEITLEPSAESQILTFSSYQIPSPKNVFEYDSMKTTEVIPHNNGHKYGSTYSQLLNENLSDSYSISDEDTQFKDKQPTISLSEKINTDFSNFFIETSIINPNNAAKKDSVEQILDLDSQPAKFHEISSSKSEPLRMLGSKLSEANSNIRLAKEVHDSSDTHSHLNKEIYNKTSRTEDDEIDNLKILMHLLGGKAPVVRPTQNGYGVYPTHLHMLRPPVHMPTRINDRGPVNPNVFNPTVVVFSQPANNARPTELALPGHLIPSTLQNHQFVRIGPTKVGEYQPPTRIHYYNLVLNPPQLIAQPNPPFPPPNPQIPFRGEVFNPHNRPNTRTKVRITALPSEFVKPSFTNPEQQYSINGNPGDKYQHFVFSDNTAPPVNVRGPSKPLETFINPNPQNSKIENSNYRNSSQSFEVLIDDTVKKNVFVNQVSSNNFDVFHEKLTSYTPLSSEAVIFAKKTENTFPHGPITDWVPFSERQPIRQKKTSSFIEDSNVSTIMHPIVFDVTVSNSVGKLENFTNITLSKDSSLIPVSSTKIENVISESTTEAIGSSSISDVEYLATNSKFFDKEYLQVDSSLVPTKIILNNSTPVLEMRKIISNSTDAFSSANIDVTPTYTADSVTKPLTITPNFDLRSSYNQGNFQTERKTTTEITEVLSRIPTLTTFPVTSISVLSNTSSTSNTSDALTVHSTSGVPGVHSMYGVPRATTTSTPKTEKTLIGRPIVIPVDIEEVRPFAGSINPTDKRFNGPFSPMDPDRKNQDQWPFSRDQGSASGNVYKSIFSTTTRTPIIRNPQRPKLNTVRIDTCIVGDDSTCNTGYNETCKMETGISSCHCRPGYARIYARGPCIPIVSLMLSIKVDRFGTQRLTFSPKYLDKYSEEYRLLEFESKIAISSLISQIPAFSRIFLGLQINTFYPIGDKIIINSTILLEEKESTRAHAIRLRLRQLIGEAIKNRNQNIGDSRLFVEGNNPVTAVEDVNECSDVNLNDCSPESTCFNIFGTYVCKCNSEYVDPFLNNERKSGRKCSACSPKYCSFHGKCIVIEDKRLCNCYGNYLGRTCEIDGEVLGAAVGATFAAVVIIIATICCLCFWKKKWKKKEQKTEDIPCQSYSSDPPLSYEGSTRNRNRNAYNLTMEDQMRWAQISDAMKNASMQRNPEPLYISPSPIPLDHSQLNDDEISYYESRNRPRPRLMGLYPVTTAPPCFEMDIPVRHYPRVGYFSFRGRNNSRESTRR